MSKIDTTLEKLQAIHKERADKKRLLMEQCQKLWTRLKISQEYIKTFVRNNSSLSTESLGRISKEVMRLEAMKKKTNKKTYIRFLGQNSGIVAYVTVFRRKSV